ncbi:MAG: hypothetical protein WCR56_04460, partial [Bacilli bacterium]
MSLTTILNIVLAAVIVIALLGGLAGFVKGIYKTTLKTILKALLILIFVFTTPSISKAIMNIDLSNWDMKFTFQGNVIQVESVQQTLAEILTSTGYISPMNGLSVYETAFAIADSLLSYVVFFLILILIQIFISLLTAIFYNGIFRWFLPVETKDERKERKKKSKETQKVTDGLPASASEAKEGKGKKKWPLLRLPGFALGTVQEFVFVILLISPLTGLCRTAINNKDSVVQVVSASGNSDTATKVSGYMDEVSASAIYQLTGIGNLDTNLMNKVSSVDVNGQSVSLNNLIDSTFDVAQPLISNGAISFNTGAGEITLNLSLLLTDEMVSTLIDKLVANPVVMALIPPLIDIGTSMLSGNSVILSQLTFDNIDWSSDLTALKGIYSNLSSTGLVSSFYNADGSFNSNFEINFSTLSDDQISYLGKAASGLGQMQVIKQNLPNLVASLGSVLASSGNDILSTDSSTYENINWSSDLEIIFTSVVKVLRALGIDYTSSYNFSTIGTTISDGLSTASTRSALKEAIVGSNSTSGKVSGLLDTELVGTMTGKLGDILYSSLKNLPSISAYVEGIDFQDIFADMTTDSLKTEFTKLFNITDLIFTSEAYTSGALDFTNLGATDIGDNKVDDLVVSVIEQAEDSSLLTNLIPSILKSFLFNGNFDFSNYLYGLTPYDFNYDSTSFLDNFKQILVLMPKIQKMTDAMSDGSKTTSEKIAAIDTDTLRSLLNILANSDFFNPAQTTGIVSTEYKNVNMYTFLSHLLSSSSFTSVGISIPSLEKMQTIEWGDGSSDGKEIDKLCSLVDEAKKNSSFFSSDVKSLSDIEDTDSLVALAREGLSSSLLQDSVLSIINDSLDTYLKDLGINLSLNDMRVSLWLSKDSNNLDDLDRLGAILKLLKGSDLNNLDMETFDTAKLNSLLTYIQSSHFITLLNANDPFGYALYSILDNQNFFTNMGINPVSVLFDSITNSFTWSETVDLNGYSITDTETSTTTYFASTTKGAIKDLSILLKGVQEKGFAAVKNGDLPKLDVSVYDSQLVKNLYSVIIENTVDYIDLGTQFNGILQSLDFSLIRTMTAAQVYSEVEMIRMLYSKKAVLASMFSDFTALSSKGYMDDFSLIMETISKSILMTTVKTGESLSPLGRVFATFISESQIGNMITFEDSTSTDTNDKVEGILASVTDWPSEENKFIKITEDVQGKDFKNMTISSLSKTEFSSLLSSMNESVVFHRAPIYLLKKTLGTSDMAKLLVDPDNSTIVHNFDFTVHLDGNSTTDVAYWQNDIDQILGLLYNTDGTKTTFFTLLTSGTLSDLEFSDSLSLDFIYYIGQMNLFKTSRSYLVYNIMKKTTGDYMSGLIHTAVNAAYGENSKVYRLEELFFENPKLVNSDAAKQKALMLNDLTMLKQVLSNLLKNMSSFSSATSLESLGLASDYFEKLNAYCFSSTDGISTSIVYR